MSAPDPDRLDVLALDDNEVNRMLVRRQLERLAVRTTCVEDPDAALAAFASQVFDLVLIDCRLQRSDGFEVARQMRTLESSLRPEWRTPLVAFTASIEPHLRDRVAAAGMDDLLHKPASIGDLRAVLVRWSGGSPGGLYPLDLDWIDRLVDEIGPGAVRALLETYLRQLPLRTAGLRAALRRTDMGAVSALAQELRAAGESIGVGALSRLCSELETAAAELAPVRDGARLDELAEATETALRAALTRGAAVPGGTP